jgi:dipeptidyl aminopeptidase/acylaminoacyl peptidase
MLRGMRHLVPLLLLFAGCASNPDPFPDAFDGPSAVEVRPATIELRTGPAGAAPVQLEAWADYGEGEWVRLEVVDWALSNRSAGTLDESGLFTPSRTNGGESLITATLDGVSGVSHLVSVFEEVRVEGEVDPSRFDGAPIVKVEGGWLYPPDGVNLPRNTPAVHFQWTDRQAELYRLSFRAPTTEVTVYTADRQWIASSEQWTSIAATNAGGVVEVDLAALVGGELWEEPRRTIEVNRFDADGSIIYWSTSSSGFVEIPYAQPARDFFTGAQAGRCVACHAISSTGRIAFTYDGGNGALGVKRIDDLTDVLAADTGATGNFKTFSPDGRFLLAATSGRLELRDGETGALLGSVHEGGDATHPDWSPDGSAVVYVSTSARSQDWIIGGTTRLMVMDHLGDGAFGPARELLASAVDRLYYPAWSPDGEWIAFNRSTGDSYDDEDATVHVIDREGRLPPIALTAANGEGALTNSWPRWGPLPDDDVMWLAFASKRPYGFQTAGNPQIWVTAFDPALAQSGVDPSWPAMWLPGQSTLTNNHIPVWVE